MKDQKILLLCLLVYFLPGQLIAENTTEREFQGLLIETNTAYLALSALSSNSNNLFLIIPVYMQIPVTSFLSIDPSIVVIHNERVQTSYTGTMMLTELGCSYHPGNRGLYGWSVGLLPGFVCSFDTAQYGFTLSANIGYQWLFDAGLVLGLFVGGRYIYINGTLIIPDLAITAGWRID
jgi:hypothetical protein